jgi:hypothetical protein
MNRVSSLRCPWPCLRLLAGALGVGRTAFAPEASTVVEASVDSATDSLTD